MKWGVVLCDPGDVRVLKKMVCHNERSATLRGRGWKRHQPDHVVRTYSLMAGDTSPAVEVGLVPLYQGRRSP